jgi:probable HAF family extracellular repeat protein
MLGCNRGEVAGTLLTADARHAFLFRNGRMTDLGVPSGAFRSDGFAINAAGHVAGDIDLEPRTAPVAHAAFWSNGRWQDLGLLPGSLDTFGLGINAFDEVVGDAIVTGDGGSGAFLWNGAMTALPCLPGASCITASAINNDGTIVGNSQTATALVWLGKTHTPYDLNALIDPRDPLSGQVHLILPASINERGQIATNGCYTAGPKNGQCFGFVATPTEDRE